VKGTYAKTVHPTPSTPVPEETARIARAALPKGNVCFEMRDGLGTLSTDEQSTDLFAIRGRPVVTPWRLALVTCLQGADLRCGPPPTRGCASPTC
jgi:transposase